MLQRVRRKREGHRQNLAACAVRVGCAPERRTLPD
jgi:hypothetical protein